MLILPKRNHFVVNILQNGYYLVEQAKFLSLPFDNTLKKLPHIILIIKHPLSITTPSGKAGKHTRLHCWFGLIIKPAKLP